MHELQCDNNCLHLFLLTDRFIGIPAEPLQEEHVYGEENEEMEDQAFTDMFTTIGAKDVIHE